MTDSPPDLDPFAAPPPLVFARCADRPGALEATCGACGWRLTSYEDDRLDQWQAAKWHEEDCGRDRFYAEIRRLDYVPALTRLASLCERAGARVVRPYWKPAKRYSVPAAFVPRWAYVIAASRAAPHRRRTRLIRQLAGDPVAAQLLLARPDTLPRLLAAPSPPRSRVREGSRA